MADQHHDKIESPPKVRAPQHDATSADEPLDATPQESFKRPTAVGCVFAQANARIAELSPAAYAELLEEL